MPAPRRIHRDHRAKRHPDQPLQPVSSTDQPLRRRPGATPEPEHSEAARQDAAECWLIARWPEGATEPDDSWLSALPEDISLAELVRRAKIRWRIEHDYRELQAAVIQILGHCPNCPYCNTSAGPT